MTSLELLPTDLLATIFEFLYQTKHNKDINNLINSSPTISREMRKEFYFFNLNKRAVILYYEEKLFRDMIHLRFKKVSVNMWHYPIRDITDVSSLANVYSLNLSMRYGITDVSALANVHTLDLSSCNGITDVSA